MEISVIMAVYNAEKTIKRALDSVLSQDFTDYEIVLVNDGSADKTKEILGNYKDKIKLINQENQGYVKAARTALSNSSGKYIIKLDADDEFQPTILSKMHAELENNQGLAFVYSNYHEKNEQTGEIREIITKDNIFNTVAIGIMFRKSVLDELGFYDENLVFPEYDLLIRILKKYKGKHIEELLFTYYRSKKSVTSNEEMVQKGMDQLRERYGKLPIRGY